MTGQPKGLAILKKVIRDDPKEIEETDTRGTQEGSFAQLAQLNANGNSGCGAPANSVGSS